MYSSVQPLSSSELLKLRRYNRALAVVFAGFALFLLQDTARSSDGRVSVWVSWFDRNKGRAERLVDDNVRVGYFSFLFLALAALDHAWVGWWGRESYEAKLNQGRNPIRWIEYALSASTMQVMIALLCGVQDVLLLFSVGFFMALCQAFGYLAELDPVRRDFLFWLGCVPFLASWAITLSTFGLAVSDQMPGFVYAIIIVLLALECLFGLNQFRDALYLNREKAYILLSPTAKLALSAMTWFGIRSL